jgi:HEAT repeat protein
MQVTRSWIVLALLVTGSALAAGCGAGKATKAYEEYRTVLAKAKKIEDVLPYLAKTRRAKVEETPAELRARMFDLLKATSEVVELKVVKETATEAGAELEVRAVTGLGTDETGKVKMVREDGTFRLDEEDWEPAAAAAAARPTCEQVAADLKSPSDVTRARAAGAVGDPNSTLHTECLAAVPILVDALADPIGGIRNNAGLALRSLLSGAARKDANAVAPFRSLLPRITAAKEAAGKASETILEMNLQSAVAAFGADAIPTLVKDLGHPERELRWGAAQMLGNLGPAAAGALPDITAAAGVEKDDLTRDALAAAERAIKGE